MNIFHNWTPREMAALSRATANLRAKQPKPKMHPQTNVRGCYYNTAQGKYLVNTYINGARVYCGSMMEWDTNAAYRMQYETERKYSNQLAK